MRSTTHPSFAVLLAVTVLAFGQSGREGQRREGQQGAAQEPPSLEELPVIGIANVTFKVRDLDKARDYYQRILGFAEAFDLTDRSGKLTSAYFKVNDDQYIEVIPTLKPGELNREARVVFQSTDLEKLHALYESRGLNPSKIQQGPDGNPVFRVVGPEGNNLDFLQYSEQSEQAKARGKFLSPDRISTHLWHVGIMTKDPATSGPFYREKLGFANLRFGTRGEYLETPGRDANTETKPPLADTPVTHVQYESEQWGAVNHIGIEVADMRAARDLAQKRGQFDDLRVRAHVGNNGHWLMFLFDPAGTRTEIVETAIQQDLPAMTVMAPGAPAPPILPKIPGVLPWP
ncbi:MAG: VOC family protein [Bryobacterales bacterium]|nr:VOC family protein [Bryobacterales bacterium]MBV9400612.1 VOC family protein [Bryobacterales bacterium]